jgi:NADPH-dependent glutamate synthase beta subunit-like oxidoreductase
VFSAREFVNWYNGHPDYATLGEKIRLDQVKNVVIIGQGNVGLDCARILSRSCEGLASTDIAAHALDILQRSSVKSISIVGRRGYAQTACTIKELRELSRLEGEGVRMRIDPSEITLGDTAATAVELGEKRPTKRIAQLLKDISESTSASQPREVHLRFLLSPVAILGQPEEEAKDRVSAVLFNRCSLQGPPHRQVAVPLQQSQTLPSSPSDVTLPCDLLLYSVGYKTLQLDSSLPFDHTTNTIPHQSGRVVTDSGNPFPGVYVTGWCKRGPTGILGTNIPDAKETAQSILDDISRDLLLEVNEEDNAWIVKRKLERDPDSMVISWHEAMLVESEERRRGRDQGKDRDKITSRAELRHLVAEKRQLTLTDTTHKTLI